MMKTLATAFLVFAIAACGNNNSEQRTNGYSETAKTPEDSLFQEVMDGHDEAMARMGKLSGLRKQAEQKLDSVSKTKSAQKKRLQDTYSSLRDQLKSAEEGMNRWMDEFQIDSAQDDTDKRIQYLNSEKMKVERVRDNIFSALDSAGKVLDTTSRAPGK